MVRKLFTPTHLPEVICLGLPDIKSFDHSSHLAVCSQVVKLHDPRGRTIQGQIKRSNKNFTFSQDVRIEFCEEAENVIAKCLQSSHREVKVQREFTGPARVTKGRSKTTKEKQQRMQKPTCRGFLHLSFPPIKDVGMGGGRDEIKTNEAEIVALLTITRAL